MPNVILEEIFVFTSIIIAMGCVTGIVVSWMKSRGRKHLVTPELMSRLNEISERLARLDGAVDTIALEVERISEAQRFTARVLADRAGPAALPEKARQG